MRPRHIETHLVERIGWLRAAVLGANDDGIAAGRKQWVFPPHHQVPPKGPEAPVSSPVCRGFYLTEPLLPSGPDQTSPVESMARAAEARHLRPPLAAIIVINTAN
jgi:hypothetical protein